MRAPVLFLAALFSLFGCSRSSTPTGADGAATEPPAEASASRTDGASAKAPAATKTYFGNYTSRQAQLTVPDAPDWKSVKFRGEESPLGLGEGAMEITIEGGDRAKGNVLGQLGPALITGVVSNGAIVGTVYRKDPSDGGFTGSFYAKQEGDALTGELKVASGNGAILRNATFSLKPKGAE